MSDESQARNKEVGLDELLAQKSVVKFNELYQLHQILGAGGFGLVCQVTCKQTQRQLALKITQLNQKSPSNAAQALENEYELLTEELCHPNIIKAYPARQTYSNYIIMEMELGLETLRQY